MIGERGEEYSLVLLIWSKKSSVGLIELGSSWTQVTAVRFYRPIRFSMAYRLAKLKLVGHFSRGRARIDAIEPG
jgi:hypothetical protein